MSSIRQTKRELRRQIRERLACLSAAQIAHDSENLRRQLRFPGGTRVALFAATSREPMLLDLIPSFPEVSWFLPKITGPGTMNFHHITHLGNLAPGAFDIPEPSGGPEAADLDVILCPGLAFTCDGRRLGHGGGYYDRALPRYPRARAIGIAFPCQLVEDLPSESHDHKMDEVLIPRPEFSAETGES